MGLCIELTGYDSQGESELFVTQLCRNLLHALCVDQYYPISHLT